MRRAFAAPESIIVAADYKPGDMPVRSRFMYRREEVRDSVLRLADKLSGTGVYLKLNSALRANGYSLITEVRSRNLKVFADLKLFDIPETLSIDGILLADVRPEILTVSCGVGIAAMKALKAQLPKTEVLGVTVLTTFTDEDSRAMFTCSTEDAVMRCAQLGAGVPVDGFICSPKEVQVMREKFGVLFTLNTPAIRPSWSIVVVDDQNPERAMTPAKAIQAGADRIVIGRPVTHTKNPREAVMRTIEEIMPYCR